MISANNPFYLQCFIINVYQQETKLGNGSGDPFITSNESHRQSHHLSRISFRAQLSQSGMTSWYPQLESLFKGCFLSKRHPVTLHEKKKNQRHLASLALGPGWRGFWTLILTGHGSIWHHWRALHCTWAKFLNSFLATVLLQRPQLLHVSRLMYHGFWDFRTIWIQRSSYPCPWKWEKPSESVKMFYKKHISPCANHSKSDSAFFLFSLGDSQVKMTGMHVVFL